MGNAALTAGSDQSSPLLAFYAMNGVGIGDIAMKLKRDDQYVQKFRAYFCSNDARPAEEVNVAALPPMQEQMPAEAAALATQEAVDAASQPAVGSDGAVLGGSVRGGAVTGGVEDLQMYGNAMYSKAKENLIRAIAEDVFVALKATGVKNAKTAPISDVVKNLTKLLPPSVRNPKKFGEAFNKSSGNQRSVCKALAHAINKHYAGALIDVDGDENAMCGKIAEIMYSLLTGLHTEFMNVAGDVMRVMNNMQLAQDYLERAYRRQRELVDSTSDPRLKDQASSTDEVYRAVKAEYERQSAILANLINVSVGPTGKSLISALEDNRDFSGLVKNLKGMVGTQAFGDKLSYLLSGVSSVAHSAELIDKALKKIGMSAAEFKSAANNTELRNRVFKHIMGQSPTSKRLDEMMQAARVIYEANYDHNAVSKLVGKHGGGDEDSDDEGVKHGGADDETNGAYWDRKKLSTKIKTKEKYRALVLTDFRKQLMAQIQSISTAANNISRKIGNELPVDDDLRRFVDAFGHLPSLDSDNLHIALSGYPKDSRSREKRDIFMLGYDSVLKAAEPLTKGPHGQLFKQVYVAVASVVKLVDDFSDKIVKAITEIHVDSPSEIAEALKKTSSSFYGAGDGGEDLFGSGSWVAFDKVKNEMVYFLSIANVKTNLARAHEDLKSYSDDYEQILGEEAGWIMDNIKNSFKGRLSIPDDAKALPGLDADADRVRIGIDAMTHAVANTGADVDAAKKQTVANLKLIWEFQLNAKLGMVRVAQAVDLYLRAFTDGMSKNPEAISSVIKMLNEVDYVARWFNDRSGDNLASLFDIFPSSVDAKGTGTYLDDANTIVNKTAINIPIPGTNHYYQYVESRWAVGAAGRTGADVNNYEVKDGHNNLPGNPFLGRKLFDNTTTNDQCKGIITLSQKVVKSMRALENLLSAFKSVGSRFGDIDPLAKTFMQPGDIFNALCNYVAASAFATEFAPGPRTDDRVTGVYRSKTRVAGIKHSDGAAEQKIPTNANRANYRADEAPTKLFSDKLSDAINNNVALPAAVVAADTGYGILTGVSNRGTTADAAQLKYSSIAMAAIPNEGSIGGNIWKYHDFSNKSERADVAGWRDMFYDTDLLFQMSIKSIVAKVFTVVDAYRLFNRPNTDRRSHYSLNPLRTILGGADGGAVLSKVKVIPEALELYYRLVLLAEWYRENFGINSAGVTPYGADAWRVTIVPSIDGIWSDFVEVIFDKARAVNEGNYTETQVQKMILAMNDIWKTYRAKYPKSTVRSILNAFVLEMNRAFGFLKQAEIQAYIDGRRDNLKSTDSYETSSGFLDYDILNANDTFGSRPAPSDKFTQVNIQSTKSRTRNVLLLHEAVLNLRKQIDLEFTNATRKTGTAYDDMTASFQESLRNYKAELTASKSDSEEYHVVLKMMQGANKRINFNANKLIMVHEAIAAPLVSIYAVYKVLARFNAMCHGCSLVNIAAWNAKRLATGNAPMNANTNECNVARNQYRAFLRDKYKLAGDSDTTRDINISMFAHAFIGDVKANDNKMTSANDDCYLIANLAQDNAITADQIDGPHMLQDLLAAVIDLGANPSKLVSVNIGVNGNINIDYNALEELCKDMLAQVRENIKKIRNSFAPADVGIVDKFESANHIGSTRWLEENLVQKLFENRDETGLAYAIQQHLLPTILRFTQQPAVPPAGAPTAAEAKAAGSANVYYGTMDNAIRGLLFYECKSAVNTLGDAHYPIKLTQFPGSVVPLLTKAESAAQKAAVSQIEEDKFNNAGGGPTDAEIRSAFNAMHPMPVICFLGDPDVNKFDLTSASAKSLMVAFNNILHMYLYNFVEDGTNKFYAPLVESFATSAASLEVMQKKAFPNVSGFNTGDPAHNNAEHTALANNSCPAGPPESGAVVYASNAIIIRSLLTSIMSIGTAQKKQFLYDNIAEIPEFLKDRMRVNLPFFSKLFNHITDRAALLKNILLNTGLKNNIHSVAATGTPADDNAALKTPIMGNVDRLSVRYGKTTSENTDYYGRMLTRIIDCSQSMRKCADGVYRELQDKPTVFFETYKDFIQEYRTRNGAMPLMPASSILSPLRCIEMPTDRWLSVNESHLLLPVKENGSNIFKFNSATRMILARNEVVPSMDHFPGAKEIYNLYASSATKDTLIQPVEYANTIKNLVTVTRFLSDGLVYGRFFTTPSRGHVVMSANVYNSSSVYKSVQWHDTADSTSDLSFAYNADVAATAGSNSIPAACSTIGDGTPLGTGAAGAVVAAAGLPPKTRTLTYANTPNSQNLSVFPLQDNSTALTKVIELTENANVSANKEALAKSLGSNISELSGSNRVQMRVLNILDAGIVPLNVHAFMREVPFTNLLNYSYTFDRMVHDFVLPSYVNDKVSAVGGMTPDNIIMPIDARANSTRELLVKLLVYPYAKLDESGVEYFALLASLFNGNDDLKLGRPRYLSDQLWHKVLLTSSVQLAAGQEMFNNPAGRYPNDIHPLASPAAYEATRAVQQYGVLNGTFGRMNAAASAHNSGIQNQHWRDAEIIKPVIFNAIQTAGQATTGSANVNRAVAKELYENTPNAGRLETANTVFAANTARVRAFIDGVVTEAKSGQPATIQARIDSMKTPFATLDATRTALTTIEMKDDAKSCFDNLLSDKKAAEYKAVEDECKLIGTNPFNTIHSTIFLALALLPARDADAVQQAVHDSLTASFTAADGNYLGNKTTVDWSTGLINTPAVVALVPVTNDCQGILSAAVCKALDAAATAAGSPARVHDYVKGLACVVVIQRLTNETNANAVAAYNTYCNGLLALANPVDIVLATDLKQHISVLPAASSRQTQANRIESIIAMSIAAGVAGFYGLIHKMFASITYAPTAAAARAALPDLYLTVNSDPVSTSGLKYWDIETKQWRVANQLNAPKNNMAAGDVIYCAELGKMRFDTKLVRNLTWFVQLQRIMRVVLTNHLSWINTPVVRGLKIANSSITEFNGNDKFDESDFDGSKYEVI